MTLKVLVTGAAGFVGGHMCEGLVAEGYDVVGLDNFDPYYDAGLKRATVAALEREARFQFIEGDVRSGDALDGPLSGCGAVVHLAARPGVRESCRSAALYHAINAEGTRTVLAACRRAGVRRVVLASSSSVYGESGDPVVEDARLAPASPYGASKVEAEAACQAFAREGGGTVAVARLFSVFGPRLRPDLVMHRFVRGMLAGQPVPRFGDGSAARDYTNIADVVRGLRAALEWTGTERRACEAFNIGSGRPVSLDSLIAALEDLLGTRACIEPLPPQPGEVRHTWADGAKAAAALGFRAEIPFVDGLRTFVRWYGESHGHAS